MTEGKLDRTGRPARPRRIDHALRLVCLVIATFVLLSPQAARSFELRCAGTSVVVHSPDLADAISICEGAVDATAFLSQHRLITNVLVEVIVVDELPDVVSPAAYGAYVAPEGRAYLLMSSKVADRGLIFDQPFEQLLYRSLATHEVAHAVASFNYRIAQPTIEAHEYIAYATMFATMPAVYRDRLLERFVDQQFDNETQINSFVYSMDPLRFGVLAYKHFDKLEDKTTFLQRILRGRELAALTYSPY